ncbi:hypothetical protein HYFRA_00000559 [Hymenoscyphus fraxineus]|uniref:MARVEL domain-containing protein n=1 Tax=Hymenoscyphus fraxineus TaxID=746836 RepID=A0A9N9PSM5_9HELO|nr:hypothetical protein HYFRA_00000559 [Hymenoscyphus fraxineus]
MISLPLLGLRGLQFLWTLLTTALIGNVIHEAIAGNPSAINYAIFVCVISWIALLFGLAGVIIESLAIPIVVLALDGLATMFTFIAGVVLAAKLGVHSCGNASYTTTNPMTNGSLNPKKRCHELQASTAFFWFLFASFVGSLFFSFLAHKSGSLSSRRSGPSMSQV